jgi:hypothetical protein
MKHLFWCPVVISAAALLVAAAPARAQFPMGGGMQGMGGRGALDRMGPDATKSMPDKPRMAKSDELVSLQPVLRGVELTPEQRVQVQGVEAKFNPLILPALDAVRTETEAGQNGDQERLQKFQQRANRYREQELADLRQLLTPDQLARVEKNISDLRARYGTTLGRP